MAFSLLVRKHGHQYLRRRTIQESEADAVNMEFDGSGPSIVDGPQGRARDSFAVTSVSQRRYRHACAECHTRSAPWRHGQLQAAGDEPGCEICASDDVRTPELCGDCVYFSCCDYCAASGIPVVRVIYERNGRRVADTVCASCAATHYVMRAGRAHARPAGA
jgi:hypothetical protein